MGKRSKVKTPCPFEGEVGRDALRRYLPSSNDGCSNDNNSFATTVMMRLDEEGYCILRGLFSAKEVDEAAERQWKFIQTVNPSIKREKPDTWQHTPGRGKGTDPWPCAQRDMFQLYQAGWIFPDLKEAFADRVFGPLYGTDQLHTSKDGWTFQ